MTNRLHTEAFTDTGLTAYRCRVSAIRRECAEHLSQDFEGSFDDLRCGSPPKEPAVLYKNSISLKAQVRGCIRCLADREEIMSCGDAKHLKSISFRCYRHRRMDEPEAAACDRLPTRREPSPERAVRHPSSPVYR